jgi:hypothetical protein
VFLAAQRLVFRLPLWGLLSLCIFADTVPLWAHATNTSMTHIWVSSERLRLQITIGEKDLLRYGLDQNGDGILWRAEMEKGIDTVFAHVTPGLKIELDGQSIALEREKGRVRLDSDRDQVMDLFFVFPLTGEPHKLVLENRFFTEFDRDHRNLIKLVAAGQPLQQAVFNTTYTRQEFVIGAEVALWTQVIDFTVLGIEHIFLGYDHIMFLLALIVFGGRLSNLVKIVTAFTLAHSITLILATLGWVSLPSKWVEVGIALTIAYVAVENLWVQKAEHRWKLTFLFGLVHGFGFANVLRDLGLPPSGLVASLLAFNIGVELGQVAIVAVLFPLILWLSRQSFQRQAVRAVSAFIFLFGAGWAIERIFELEYMPF